MYQNSYKYIIIIILFPILSSLLFSSCGVCKKRCNCRPEEKVEKDSIKIIIETKLVKDTVYIDVPLQEKENIIKDSVSHLETDYAVSDARIEKDGYLFHSLKNKEGQKSFIISNIIEKRDTIRYREKREVIIKEVPRELSWFQKTQMYGFWCILFIPLIISFFKKIRQLLLK